MKTTLIRLLVLLTLLTGNRVVAQVWDDFERTELRQQDNWTGAEAWVLENGKLRSNSDTLNGAFQLFTTTQTHFPGQWELWVNLKFNPSSANYVDFFLVADSSPHLARNGYFVRMGNTRDEVSLYRLLNGVATEIISGLDGVLNTSDNTFRVKVTRNVNFQWALYRSAEADYNYFNEGTVTDSSVRSGRFTGIRVRQSTASFHKRHYFDDFYAGPLILDTIPPWVSTARFLNRKTLEIRVSERIENQARDLMQGINLEGFGSPDSLMIMPDRVSIQARWEALNARAGYYTVYVAGLRDKEENESAGQMIRFLGGIPDTPSWAQLLITEIMADPDPVVGLPNVEWVEILNRSNTYVTLAGCRFEDLSSGVVLPDTWLAPGQHVLLVPASGAASMQVFSRCVPLSTWPSLNNSGDWLRLLAPDGQNIHELEYSDAWYGNALKKHGGWSLEMIDTANFCGASLNWTASVDPLGGTPGRLNSVAGLNPDREPPRLTDIYPLNERTLRLNFSEPMKVEPVHAWQFDLSGNLRVETVIRGNSSREYLLTCSQSFSIDALYQLRVSGMKDCAGNPVTGADLPFMWPLHTPESRRYANHRNSV
jgi:hypothetical protein